MLPRLFKYVKASTAIRVLEKRILRWRSPDGFNDPFELKNPLEFGFEWEEMKRAYRQRLIAIISQPHDPPLLEGNPVAPMIREARAQCKKGRDPETMWSGMNAQFEGLVEHWKALSIGDRNTWIEMKRRYRILCLSAVHDHILMWSHYADEHRGIVFEFLPTIGQPTATLAAPVLYSNEVPVAVTLEEYIQFLTGVGPRPNGRNAWRRSIYIKSSAWAYEKEWRTINIKQSDEQEEYSDREFHPHELVSVFLGCRISSESRSQIIAVLAEWKSPVSIFQMRDQRIRFELTSESI